MGRHGRKLEVQRVECFHVPPHRVQGLGGGVYGSASVPTPWLMVVGWTMGVFEGDKPGRGGCMVQLRRPPPATSRHHPANHRAEEGTALSSLLLSSLELSDTNVYRP